MNYTETTLKEDTRWDMISFQAYGSVDHVPDIAEANPTLPLSEYVPAGTTIYLPILETPEIQAALLPPWKR